MTSPTTVPALATVPSVEGMAGAGNVEAGNQFTNMNTTAIAKLSSAKLYDALAKASDISDAICSEMIAAGRGHELGSETRTKSDPLSLRYIANSNLLGELYSEKARRMEWHGSTKPIKRAA